MSKLPGLSLIAKDPDNSIKDVRFINIDNTTVDEPIFIAGTATDIYEVDNQTVNSSDIDNVAHGKFSKLSLVNKNQSSGSVQAVEDLEKGETNYIYVDINTGQLKTNSFSDLFENEIFMQNLVLQDTQNQNVTLTGDELRQLKDLLPD